MEVSLLPQVKTLIDLKASTGFGGIFVHLLGVLVVVIVLNSFTPLLSPTMETHEAMIEKALAFYKRHDIEPFRVVDIEAFDNDWGKLTLYNCDGNGSDIVVRYLCFFMITGDFTNIGDNGEHLEADLVPYLMMAAGLYPTGFRGIMSSLWDERRDKRREWQNNNTIAFKEIDEMARAYHLMQNENRVRQHGKNLLKRYRQRWDPFASFTSKREPIDRPPMIAMAQVEIPKAKEDMAD